MVERRVCTFCGDEIEPGTGRMYIKKDGTVYHFCSSKCFKNMIVLGRVPRRTTWTRYYEREKEVRMKGAQVAEPQPAKARKVRKGEAKPKEETAEKKLEPEKPRLAKKEEAPKKEGSAKTGKKPDAKKPAPKKEIPKPKGEEVKE